MLGMKTCWKSLLKSEIPLKYLSSLRIWKTGLLIYINVLFKTPTSFILPGELELYDRDQFQQIHPDPGQQGLQDRNGAEQGGSWFLIEWLAYVCAKHSNNGSIIQQYTAAAERIMDEQY